MEGKKVTKKEADKIDYFSWKLQPEPDLTSPDQPLKILRL